MRPVKEYRLHFIGIGGIGMSGIAEVFLRQGFAVSGSDLSDSPVIGNLKNLGARIFIGHSANQIHGAHVVVYSSAVKSDNPELVEAHRQRIPAIPRAEMLAELMRGKTGIALAGSHGKTTTTSMVATILGGVGLDPTVVIGGKLDSIGGNARLGLGQFVVAEADESDGSFLKLPATFAAVTNIDNDHLDYYRDIAAIDHAFIEFVSNLPFYGCALVCGDDLGVKRCLSRFRKPFRTYGFDSNNDYYASEINLDDSGSEFVLYARNEESGFNKLGRVRLSVPGRHNILNSMAAIGIAIEAGIDFEKAASAITEYRGVKRRFEIKYRDVARSIAIVDDYGHHPAEIQATLAAARVFWKGKIRVVFQPHRYTRTLHCREGFLSAFKDCDEVWLTDIYAAGESPIEGVHSSLLAEDLRRVEGGNKSVHYVPSLDEVKSKIAQQIRNGDLVICMGAGSITRLADALVEALK